MLNDFFADVEFALPWDTFLALPRHPAFRYEYRLGRVRITGNPRYYHAELGLGIPMTAGNRPPERFSARRGTNAGPEFRPLEMDDWPRLAGLFAESFSMSPPLAQLSEAARLEAAHSLLSRTRDGFDGPVVAAASFVATEQDGGLIGAVLVTLVPAADIDNLTAPEWQEQAPENAEETGWGRPHLTWIFVAPDCRRDGLGTALLRRACQELLSRGDSSLLTTFLLGDTASMLWHWKVGFRLLSYPGRFRRDSAAS